MLNVCVHVCACACVHVSWVAAADGRKTTPESDRRETGQAITHSNTHTKGELRVLVSALHLPSDTLNTGQVYFSFCSLAPLKLFAKTDS